MSVHILIDGTYDQYWFKHDSISMQLIDQRTFSKSSINIESILIDVLIISIAQYRSMVPKIFEFLLFDHRWSMVSTLFSKLYTCASINIDSFYQYWFFINHDQYRSSMIQCIDQWWFLLLSFILCINVDKYWSILISSYRFLLSDLQYYESEYAISQAHCYPACSLCNCVHRVLRTTFFITRFRSYW